MNNILQIYTVYTPAPWAARARRAPATTLGEVERRLARLEAQTIRDAHIAAGETITRRNAQKMICLRSVDPLKVPIEWYRTVNGIGMDAVCAALWVPPNPDGTIDHQLMRVLGDLIHHVHPADLQKWFPNEKALRDLKLFSAVATAMPDPNFKAWIERLKITPEDMAKAMGLEVDPAQDAALVKVLANLRDAMPQQSLDALLANGISTQFWD